MSTRHIIRKRKYVRKPMRYSPKTLSTRPYRGAIPRGPSGVYGIPDNAYATLRYTDTKLYSGPLAAGGVQVNIYSMNGLYDPDQSGGGHQPMGFDQLMNLYKHYCVYAVRCTLTAATPRLTNYFVENPYTGQSLQQGCRWAILPQRDTVGNTDQNTIIESTEYVTPFTLNEVKLRTAWIDIATFHGRNRQEIFTEQAFSGLDSIVPAQQAFFYVYQMAPLSFGVQVSYDVSVTLEYKARFYERRTLGTS